MWAVSMWRWDTSMSASVASRGMMRYEGSPHHGFSRSPSASNGGSPFIEMPAVLTRLTVEAERGRDSGVQGTGSRGARAIMDSLIALDAGLRYLNESTERSGAGIVTS